MEEAYMEYMKKSGDCEYRLVNLRTWDRLVSFRKFPDNGKVRDNSQYQVLEIKEHDGTRRIVSDNEPKESAQCSILNGKIQIIFSGTRVREETIPCVAHLYIIYKNRPGIRYHFPRVEQVRATANEIIYEAHIGNIAPADIAIIGDEYFTSAFDLTGV